MTLGYTADILEGINLDLHELTYSQKKNLVKFIGRISEISYRRGFQQAHAMHDIIDYDPAKLRYERDIDKAPWAETGSGNRTVLDILRIEYGHAFDEIGVPVNGR